jgi:hypothetical protein
MAGQGRWRRLGGLALVALLASGGCLNFVNPVEPAPPDDTQACKDIPNYCRNRVYIFFFQGLDPAFACNIDGVRDYVQSLGFIKTYFGYFYHPWYFHREAVRIHQEEPDARFVLVGFSFGANAARGMANMLKDDHIPVDLLVYFGGNTFDNTPDTTPDNALKVVNILSTGFIWNGSDLDRAENIHYDDCWHFGSPAHKKSTDMLTRELAVVARRVPIPSTELALSRPPGPVPPAASMPFVGPPTPRLTPQAPDLQRLPPPTNQGPQNPQLPPPTEEKSQGNWPAPKKSQVGAQIGRNWIMSDRNPNKPSAKPQTQQMPPGKQQPPPTQQSPTARKDDWSFLEPENEPTMQGTSPGRLAPLAPLPDPRQWDNKPK